MIDSNDTRPGLIRKNPDGSFRTRPAAAYGPGLCMSLAGHIFHPGYSMLTSSGVLETPAAGGGPPVGDRVGSSPVDRATAIFEAGFAFG